MRGVDHLLSKLAGHLAECGQPLLKNALISLYSLAYRVDLGEAEHDDPRRYRDFNHFFTRALRPDVRPLQGADDAVLSPADGVLTELREIDATASSKIKGRAYSLPALLGDDLHADEPPRAPDFAAGSALGVYLSPRDYHRVHSPLAGELHHVRYIPGRLFPVNALSRRWVANLSARNERLACFFDGEAGPFALIFIAALVVGGIRTIWAPDGDHRSPIDRRAFAQGEEVGHFRLGSSVVCLFSRRMRETHRDIGAAVRMGQRLATLN